MHPFLRTAAVYLGSTSIAVSALAAETTQIDLKPDGTPILALSEVGMSGDGRIAIIVTGSAMLPNDNNTMFDVYARDLATGAVDLVSVSVTGGVGNTGALAHAVSYDGRYVAFTSKAANLVANDVYGKIDVFVRDRVAGVTEIVSVSSAGVFGDFTSTLPAISADGRYVAFVSTANNLVPGDFGDTQDIFVRDRVTQTTTRVNVDANGVYKPGSSVGASLSADGRYVGFRSTQGLVPPSVGLSEFLVKDRLTGAIVRASVNNAGQPANQSTFGGSLSPDGRYAMFTTTATNVITPDTNGNYDVFVRDLVANVTEALALTPQGSLGNGNSSGVDSAANAFSSDGRFVVFHSTSTDLAPVTTATGTGFLRDRLLRRTSRLTFSPDGLPANSSAGANAISWDGTQVIIGSYATNLTATPTNGSGHGFLRIRTGFQDLHGGIAGAGGVIPHLTGTGTLSIGGSGTLTLTGAPPAMPSVWFLSLSFAQTPFFGGILAAYPPFQLTLGATDLAGAESMPWAIGPTPVLTTEAFLQVALPDSGAPQGVALSNVLLLGFN